MVCERGGETSNAALIRASVKNRGFEFQIARFRLALMSLTADLFPVLNCDDAQLWMPGILYLPKYKGECVGILTLLSTSTLSISLSTKGL